MNPTETELTVEACVTRYLRYLAAVGMRCVKTYGPRLKAWMVWLDAAGLTTEDGQPISRQSAMTAVNSIEVVGAYYHQERKRRQADDKPINNNTIRVAGNALRGLWAFCCDTEPWMPGRSPLAWNACIRVPMPKQTKPVRVHTKADKVQALLDACNRLKTPRECALAYAVMQVYLSGALRRRELLALEISDWDNKRTVYLRAAKGDQATTQPLSSEAAAAVRAYLGLRGSYVRGRWEQQPNKSWKHVPDPTAPDYLFTTSEKRRLGDAGVRSLIRRLCNIAGIPEDFRMAPHVVRRFQGTQVYRQRGLKAAQRLLRHKNARTTLIYLGDVDEVEIEEVVEEVSMKRSKHTAVAAGVIKPVGSGSAAGNFWL